MSLLRNRWDSLPQPRPLRHAVTAVLIAGAAAACGAPGASVTAEGDEPVGAIVFVRSSGRTAELRAVDVESGADRLVEAGEGRVSTPAWSPNGERLAYARRDFRTAGGFAIEILELASGERRRLTPGRAIEGSPAWSPGGDAIAFSANWDGPSFGIYLVPVDGGEPRRLTDGRAPAWSPDGTAIAFVRIEDGVPRVRRVDPRSDEPDTDEVTEPDSLGERDPSWSPDGARLAVSSLSAAGDWDLTILEVASGRRRTIERPGTDERHPSWSPDGAWIAFARVSGESSAIWIVNPESGAERSVSSSTEFDLTPSWGPRDAR